MLGDGHMNQPEEKDLNFDRLKIALYCPAYRSLFPFGTCSVISNCSLVQKSNCRMNITPVSMWQSFFSARQAPRRFVSFHSVRPDIDPCLKIEVTETYQMGQAGRDRDLGNGLKSDRRVARADGYSTRLFA
jgi:hypothetical protein